MNKIIQQIPLNLSYDINRTRADFLVGESNEAALNFIERWPDWHEPWVYLQGEEGTGKSHLLSIWVDNSQGILIEGRHLKPELIPDILQYKAIAIDHIDYGETDLTALFHLLNSSRESSCSLLLAARRQPKNWASGLPDLYSRLRMAIPIHLSRADDILMQQVIIKLFADRQIDVELPIVEFILKRVDRSFHKLEEMVRNLDEYSLSEKKRITKPFIRNYLMTDSDN